MLHGAGDIGFRRITSISDTSAALHGVVFHGIILRSITPSNADGITPFSSTPSNADGITPRGSGGIVFSSGIAFSGA